MAKLVSTLFLIFSLFILSQARIPRTAIPSDHDVEAVNLQLQDLTDLGSIGPGLLHPIRPRCGGFRHRHHLHHGYGNDGIFSGPGGHVEGGDVDGFRHRHHLHRHHGFRSYGNDGIFGGPGFHGNGFEGHTMSFTGGVESGDVDKEQTYVDREEAGWMNKVRKFLDAFGF